MKHIAVVTETWPPEINGVARTIKRMVDGLIVRGYHVDLIRPRQSKQDKAKTSAHFKEFLMRGFRAPRYPEVRVGYPAYRKLKRQWKEHKPDLVQIVTEGPLGYSAASAARKLGIPLISDFHTRFDQYSQYYGVGAFKWLTSAYLKRLHNRSGPTLVPTHELADDLLKMGFDKPVVIERGIDCQLFNPRFRSEKLRVKLGVKPAQLLVGVVARMAVEKNLDLAVQAYQEIKRFIPDAMMVMVGDGPERARLQQEHPDIIFTGMKTRQDLAEHYASIDLFLAPSKSETFGNVTLEAMASGLPVVTFDYAAAHVHIQNGSNGICVDFEDNETFIDAALKLALDPKQSERIGKLASVSVQKLDWNHIVDKLDQLICNQIEESSNGLVTTA